jgi:hypothetical protein
MKGLNRIHLTNISFLFKGTKLEGNFDIGVKEEHLFSAGLDLIYSSKKTAILLSKESHSFHEEVKYSLNSYVILDKENGE